VPEASAVCHVSSPILFIWALLVYIADNYKEVRFRFDRVRGELTIDGI
jgi:hypothetical protein